MQLELISFELAAESWREESTRLEVITKKIQRYFPTQAFNFAMKDNIKRLFPKCNPKKEFAKFFAINMASGCIAGPRPTSRDPQSHALKYKWPPKQDPCRQDLCRMAYLLGRVHAKN